MVSVFEIGISQNNKCDNLVSFLKSGHILYTHSHSVSSFGGDGLIPNILFILEKDPLRFSPVELEVGCHVKIHSDILE